MTLASTLAPQTDHLDLASPVLANDNCVNVQIVIGEGGTAYVIYDRPFNKLLSWLEYDLDKDSLQFVMEDGDLRNFGVPVAKDVGKYLQNTHYVSFVYMTGERINDSLELPLIVHRC